MVQVIRQGATHKVVIGPFVDVGDAFTPETPTISAGDDVIAVLHDNATVVDISAYTWAAITNADGLQFLTLQSGISNTVGHLTIYVRDDSVFLPVKADFIVMDTGVYDSLYADAAASLATESKQDTIDTVVDGIQTDLDNGTDGLGALKTLIDTVNTDLSNGTDGLGALKTLIDTVNTDLSNGTDGLGALKTLIDALNDLSAANILTEVNSALDAAISELGVAAPTATPSVRTGLMLMYMALRNKLVVQTSGTDALELYNNAGTKIAAKLLTDDGSDYTEAEMA